MNAAFFLLARFTILWLMLINAALAAQTLEEQLKELQTHQDLAESKKATLQLLIEQFNAANISWQKDDQIGLRAFVNGQDSQKNLVFATSVLSSAKQLSSLVKLLQISSLQAPKKNLQVLFLLHEEIEQPQRSQFSYSPYNQFKISAFSSSQAFMNSGEIAAIEAVFYLVTLEKPALIITKDTPLSFLKMVWSQLGFLSLNGGMREFSRIRDFPELEDLYARYNIPLILLSMPETTDIQASELFYNLSLEEQEDNDSGFFYALSFNKKLYILQDILIYAMLIILQLCWVFTDLTRFHARINWHVIISFLLLLVASVSLAFSFEIWLLKLFPQTLSKRVLSYFIALLSSQIILFLPIRLPRTQLSLRLLEASLAALFIYACIQRPLTALFIIFLLILLTLCQHLLRITLRRILISTTLFLIFLLFLFLAFEEARQDPSSYFGLLLVLPILALVSLQHNLHGIRRNAQIWLNITIFSLTIFGISLSLRSKTKLFPDSTLINYRFEFSHNQRTQGRIYFQADPNNPISLNNAALNNSAQKIAITLEAPTSQLTRLENRRRNFYTLHLDYPYPLEVLLIKLPEQTFVRDRQLQLISKNLVAFYQPSLPLDLELISFQDQALTIDFAATLTQEPFAPSLSSSKPLFIESNTELYWSATVTNFSN